MGRTDSPEGAVPPGEIADRELRPDRSPAMDPQPPSEDAPAAEPVRDRDPEMPLLEAERIL